MSDLNNIIVVLFVFSGAIAVFFGSVGLSVDYKSKLNRVFFAICLSLGVWSFGFGMFEHAANYEDALLWRRVAGTGCGMFYPLLLHFALELTNKRKILNSRLLMVLLYTPFFVVNIFFNIINETAIRLYPLVQTDYGWNTLWVDSYMMVHFVFFFILYSVLALGLILQWGIRSKDPAQRKYAILLFGAFLFTFIIGSFTDVFVNMIMPTKIPQIVPILAILPMMVIFYTIVKFGFLLPTKQAIDVSIINKFTRKQAFNRISVIFIVGCLLNCFAFTIYYGSFTKALPSSAIILFLGLLIRLINLVRLNSGLKDVILVAIIFISIPVVTLPHLAFGNTIWAISFLAIFFAFLFTKQKALTVVLVSVVVTQFVSWLIVPEATITVGYVSYLSRTGILLLALWLAYYVNGIYVKKLAENAKQVHMQKLVSDISADLLSLNQTNIETIYYELLTRVSEFLDADRSCLYFQDGEESLWDCVSEWDNNARPHKKRMQGIRHEHMAMLLNKLEKEHMIIIDSGNDIPTVDSWFLDLVRIHGMKSLVCVPICLNKKIRGFLTIAAGSIKQTWTKESTSFLSIVSNNLSDALSRLEAENEIAFMAYHDSLTKLPNRNLFNDRLSQAIKLANRTERHIGVIFLDLDSFKSVNDTLGHQGGDELLKIVSNRLQGVVRESDTVSRFGGDEFLIMINNIEHYQDITIIVDKIMKQFSEPFILKGQEFYVSTSAGISVYPIDGNDPEELIKNADISMYKAKEKGKNQYLICSAELKEDIIYNLKITNNLYRALERGEFFLNFQPQVQVVTNEIIGLEALLRWKHPELGFISPAVFIPIAEKIGVINSIGEWVLREACSYNKNWMDSGHKPVCMAVNVSTNQLRDPDFTKNISAIIEDLDYDPKYLELEITESSALDETVPIVTLLNNINSIGIATSIDDFGTDYSSLSRLKLMPIDKIKIDKQFIDGIEDGEKDRAIVRTIINLGRNLSVKVIAEGVENIKQRDFLRQEYCDEIQGYFYYKPMNAIDIEKLLSST